MRVPRFALVGLVMAMALVLGGASVDRGSIGADDAMTLLFGESDDEERDTCREGIEAERIRCLLALRFARDPGAAKAALELYDGAGWVAGVEHPYTMDGGWRGKVRLVPELPVGKHRRHLKWALAATRDFAAFFAGVAAHAERPLAYRWRSLAIKYFRSVGRTTPSAYAARWYIGYNVSGSLHRSAERVRRTLFHEIFHMNDADHDDWSEGALQDIFDGIVARCTARKGAKLRDKCLSRFAPNGTKVRGSTYYAFHPGEGVEEYAAELAIRYYRETRAILNETGLTAPAFKCGPEENGRAWRLLVEEFFSGVDLVPACG